MLPVLMSVVAALSAAPAAGVSSDDGAAPLPDRVVVGFLDEGAGERWVTVNDGVMGGRSTGGPSFADGLMTFSGVTNTNGGGFSSIRSAPVELDLSIYAGLRLNVIGDGRRYTWRPTTPAREQWWRSWSRGT